ncbi:MAG: 23S rRNA (adenine(2030)-N(6))-methyltransferase RlmJ [Holosporales bacterium]
MNYRHAFHAGNFADVLKHQLLAWQLEHLRQKPTPFFVLDTHAGLGLYDLTSEPAQRSPEFMGGIARARPHLPPSLYTAALDELNDTSSESPLRFYPGSPYLIQMALRDDDRASFCELHPEDAKALQFTIFDHRKTKVQVTDGFQALAAQLPPQERRGLILIDPAFEDRAEFDHLARGLMQALKRFRHGSYLIWFPIKNENHTKAFLQQLETCPLPETWFMDITLNVTRTPTALNRIGFLLLNPSWGMEEKVRAHFPSLLQAMNQGRDYEMVFKKIRGEA